MKAITTKAAIALVLMSALAPVASSPAEARNRGAKIAAGVILGAAAIAVLANSSRRAHARERYVSVCRSWYRSCVRGNDYACEKYETRGCTE